MIAGGFRADADAIFTASTRFLSMKDYLDSVEGGLIGDLQGTVGMAGDDKAGRAFSAAYTPAARTTVQAVGVSAAGSAAISGKLLTMAWNYLIADDAVAASLIGGTPRLDSGMASGSQDCEPSSQYTALSQVQQHHDWAVNHLIAPFWPEGDPGRLRDAAATWHKASALLSEVTADLSSAVGKMTGVCEGVAFDAFYTYADQFVGLKGQSNALLSLTTKACEDISSLCTSYAERIEARRRDVEHTAEAAGVIAGVGLVLTIFTFGGSDGAAEAIDAGLATDLAASAEVFAEGVITDEALTALLEEESLLADDLPKVLLSVPAAMAAPNLPRVTQPTSTSGTTSTAGVSGSTTSVSAILGAAYGTPTPGVGPIAPSVPPFSPLLTGTSLADFNQWFARIPQGPVKPTNPSDLAYQLRIAGSTEYLLPTGVTTGPGQTMAADGIRPADGALIEAKNVRAPGCTPRTLAGIQSANRVTGFLTPGDQAELAKYGQALAYPGTQARYLELDTNDQDAVGYWQFLAAAQGVKTNVRYIP